MKGSVPLRRHPAHVHQIRKRVEALGVGLRRRRRLHHLALLLLAELLLTLAVRLQLIPTHPQIQIQIERAM